MDVADDLLTVSRPWANLEPNSCVDEVACAFILCLNRLAQVLLDAHEEIRPATAHRGDRRGCPDPCPAGRDESLEAEAELLRQVGYAPEDHPSQ